MKKSIYLIAGMMLFVLFQQCKRDDRLDHIDENAPAPAQVSNIKSISTLGGAILTYKIPSDPNLSYVKAVYEIQPGVFREGKSSYYTDSLKLEGFGDTNEYKVKLYSVGKNEKASEPLEVTIKPLIPPVISAFEDLTMEAGFGGVKIRFKNKLEANIAIVLQGDTTGSGTILPIQTFYTKTPAGSFSVRGMSSTEKKFSVYLKDRWNNKSPALVKSFTPLFEQKVPKPFATVKLPTDEWEPVEPNYPMERLWDNDINSIFASRHTTVLPQWFTLDLGKTVILSRMKMNQRAPEYTYTGANVKSFEIYSSNNPNSDGSFGNWKLLGSFKSFKPSGLPMGTVTQEDINYAYTQGEDFEFDGLQQGYRYIRFKSLETYGGGAQVTIAELNFWGKF